MTTISKRHPGIKKQLKDMKESVRFAEEKLKQYKDDLETTITPILKQYGVTPVRPLNDIRLEKDWSGSGNLLCCDLHLSENNLTEAQLSEIGRKLWMNNVNMGGKDHKYPNQEMLPIIYHD